MPVAPEDAGLLAKITAGIGAALAAISTWAWTHTHKRIDEKADKDAFEKLSERIDSHTISRDMFEEHVKSDERRLEDLNDEITTQRGNISKLFDKMSDMDHRSHAHHVELLNAINAKK